MEPHLERAVKHYGAAPLGSRGNNASMEPHLERAVKHIAGFKDRLEALASMEPHLERAVKP